MDTVQNIPPDAFRPAGDDCVIAAIEKALVEADGDDWGEMGIAEAQARLESDDDLVILQLRSAFTTAAEITGAGVEVNGAGLRTLDVDGTYAVLDKGAAREGCERYRLPDPFPAGEHKLEWSYVWNPPKDCSTGEPLPDGVTLLPPWLMRSEPGSLARVQADVDVPVGVRGLVVEGPAPGNVSASIDGAQLPSADSAGCLELPPGISGKMTLYLEFPSDAVLRGATFVR